MKKRLIILASLLASLGMNAQITSVSSPDGKLKVNFDIKDTKPMYEVIYDGKQMLDYSPLGFVADNGDYTQDITYVSSVKSDNVQKESYTMNRSKYSKIDVEYNELFVVLKNKDNFMFSVQFRVENNDIAFRYTITNHPSRQNEKKFSMRIMKEATGFDLPHQTTTFLTPQSHAMIGWKGTKPSYEEEYKYDEPMTSKSQYGHGYTFPALFHVNAIDKNDKDGWVLISETDVDSRYCASRLSDMKGDGLYTLEFPMPEENGGNGTIEPAFSLPNNTPWRTITVGTSLKPIVETTIPWDFTRENLFEPSHPYKFGKGTWSWIVWQDNSINTKDLMEYAKLSKTMGYEYMLIDNWWDNNIGYDKMEQFVKTVQGMGVDVFLWWSSSGYWNDIEQGPINKMDNPIQRKKVMRWMQKLGVKGIKVDFFGGDKQETMRLYEAILSDANDCGLMVIFHGCTIPRGWERMYPNYVGSEAVLASENIYFTQGAADKEAKDAATHPFIRNAIGCMEFGGCFMNRHIHRGNRGGNTRRTTDVHELATCVLFQNPIQNFAITPENLGDDGSITDFNAEGAPAPKLCMDFLKDVPTTWDETIYIDGYPGKYVVLARRSGSTWYIAGNNATGAPLTLRLSLPMLRKGEAALYSDNLKTREPQKSTLKYNGKTATITMPDQGGFVIVQ